MYEESINETYYTLKGIQGGGTLDYYLEDFQGKRLDINKLNGNIKQFLNVCYVHFNSKAEEFAIDDENKEIISIEEKPHEIKKILNMRYELYKDNCFLHNVEPSNIGYMSFIDDWRKKYFQLFGKDILQDPDDFDDYLKYEVLSKIAKNFALSESAVEHMSYSMYKFLEKYEIISEDTGEIINLSLYNRIAFAYQNTFEKKVLDNYDSYFDALPNSLKEKYYEILKPDYRKDGIEKYNDLKDKKMTLDHIEQLEDIKEPIKILIKFSESATIDCQVYKYDEMNDLCKKAEDEVLIEKLQGKRHPETYDKVAFYMFIEDKEKINLFMTDRIDIGDGQQSDFKSFIIKFYGYEQLLELEKIQHDFVVNEEESR